MLVMLTHVYLQPDLNNKLRVHGMTTYHLLVWAYRCSLDHASVGQLSSTEVGESTQWGMV